MAYHLNKSNLLRTPESLGSRSPRFTCQLSAIRPVDAREEQGQTDCYAHKPARISSHNILYTLMLLCGMAFHSYGAVLTTETWSGTDAEGWTGQGNISFGLNTGVGNPAGSLMGVFGSQAIPALELGSFRATAAASSGGFIGDYWSDVQGWTGWRFDFLAADILPSDLQLRIHGVGWTIWFNATAQISSVGGWNSVFVPSMYSSGWLPPGNEANWSNAFTAVEWIEVQVARSGTDNQAYYLDNFRINMPAIIPEPSYLSLILLFAAIFMRSWYSRGRIGYGVTNESAAREKQREAHVSCCPDVYDAPTFPIQE